MTWGRKTGGRKKGTPNKIKKPPALMAEAQAEVAAAVSANEGLQPLDYMLAVMRDPTASEARRDMMAKAAAPYRHPQLAAVAHRHTNADGSPILPTINLVIQQPRTPAVEANTAEAAPTTPLLPPPADSLGDPSL